ncbi:hypothetical protein PHMEG_0005922 [Phytophthora megakarya]|uniref:Transmembrane protein n=1 Tax=Phytophthora megakarya TaxID=4795 RepID=A0A225WQ58_9STRA|nr:hypothetical protein PHMEG_0005922 [Phytophthora megakarya]
MQSRLFTLLLLICMVTSVFDAIQAADIASNFNSIMRRLDKLPLTQVIANNRVKTLEDYRRLDAIEGEQERAVERASGVGEFFRKFITKIRGGTDEYYRNLITAVKITLCEHGLSKNEVRFVNSSDDVAYRDDDGNCVKLQISNQTESYVVNAYNKGLCEVQPNCYWASIDEDDFYRARVYADPDSAMNKHTAEAKLKAWVMGVIGVIGFVLPGIILGVLSLFTMVFFLSCRCCCNRCGGRYPCKEGYTRRQRYVPLFIFLFFSVGVFVVSTAALLYRNSILESVDEMFNATSGLLVNGSSWVVSIRTPLVNVRDTVNTSVNLVITELNGSDFIENGVFGLIGKLRAFGEYSANRTLPDGCSVDKDQSKEKYIGTNGNLCLPCDVCTTISVEIETASDEIEAKADPGVQQLITVRSQLKNKLVNIAGTVRDAVNSKVLVADDLNTTLNVTRAKVDNYHDIFMTSRRMIEIEIMKLFTFAGSVIALGVLGLFFGLTPLKRLANIIHLAYFWGFIVLIVIFIVSSVVLGFGIVLGDTCEISLIFSTNWTVPFGTSARAIDACFQNESLLDVFDLSSQLAFARGGIQFPTINVNSMLDFSALDNFSATIATTKDTSFAFMEYITNRYENYNDDCVGIPNSDYGKPFVCTNHKNPCHFSEFMGEQFGVLVNIANIKNSVFNFADHLQHNVSDIVDFTHEFKTNITNLLSRVEKIKRNLESNLIKYVNDFEDVMYCTFIAEAFFSMYDAICVHLAPSITMIGLMMLAVGILLIPVNVSLIIGIKRLKGRFGPILPSDVKFINLKATNMPTS